LVLRSEGPHRSMRRGSVRRPKKAPHGRIVRGRRRPNGPSRPESYLGNHYSQDAIFIHVALNSGRSLELKKAFHKRIVNDLQTQSKMQPDDVVINWVEVPKKNGCSEMGS
jgi:Tautomerase enzyme